MTEEQMLYIERNYRSIWAMKAVENILKAAEEKNDARKEHSFLLKAKKLINLCIKHSHNYLSPTDPTEYGKKHQIDKDMIEVIYWLYRADAVNFEPAKENHLKRALQAVERAIVVNEAKTGETENDK